MQFLSRTLREGTLNVSASDKTPERSMVISLLHDGYLNGIESVSWDREDAPAGAWNGQIGRNTLLDKFEQTRCNELARLLSGRRNVEVQISHKGRVRLSELQQQLKTGRDRDDTGLLWAKRHVAMDLAIAVLSASKETPLSVAFLDMNGLKLINDTHGHPAGDEAIRAFFQAVVATLGQNGEAFRNGGDEVVVILPGVTDEAATKLMDSFVRQLGKDVLVLGDARAELRLTASCGSVSTTDPKEDAATLLKRADDTEIRAKNKSRETMPRMSAVAVGDGEVATYPVAWCAS
jgi:diguanylate cyclase (GGDEF)-like protein